jgi:hypothetical protein
MFNNPGNRVEATYLISAPEGLGLSSIAQVDMQEKDPL